MPFDFTTVSPEARARYVHLGRQWGSADTLAQASKTLLGLDRYGADLVRYGFAPGDTADLKSARDGLVDEGVGRAGEVGVKKVTSQAHIAAIREGKDERQSAHAILSSAANVLLRQGGAAEGLRVIKTALDQTSSAQDDADKLADQLTLLRDALQQTAVAAAAQDRGGPEAVTALDAKILALRASAELRATGPGTPAATERLDILDGIIVTLARAARKAARVASRRLGTPAMLADFELTHLYGTRSTAPAVPKTTPKEAPKAPDAPKTPETPAPAGGTPEAPGKTADAAGTAETSADKKPG